MPPCPRPLCLLLSLLWLTACDADARVCQADLDCFLGESCRSGQCQSVAPAGVLPDMSPATTLCSPPRPTRCGEVCVDTQSDATACGSCNQACAQGQVCLEGVCSEGSTCSQGMLVCQGRCVPCPGGKDGASVSCDEGRCVSQCAPGFVQCDSGCCPAVENAPTTGVIDRAEGFGKLSSVQLRIGPGDLPVIGYIGSSQDVHLAQWDGRQWQITRATQNKKTSTISMDLDARGGTHLVLHETETGQLNLLESLNNQRWNLTVLPTETVRSMGALLRLDGQGREHIVYRAKTGLSHLWRDGASWKQETIDAFGDDSDPYDFAISRDQTLYVALIERDDLFVTSKSAETFWKKEKTPLRHDFQTVELGAATRGILHLVGRDFRTLYYLRSANAEDFTSEAIKELTGFGTSVDLALDQLEQAHLCLISSDDRSLLYAYKGATKVWEIEVVEKDLGLRAAQNCAIDLDSRGNPHIGYHAGRNGELRYARKQDGQWLK